MSVDWVLGTSKITCRKGIVRERISLVTAQFARRDFDEQPNEIPEHFDRADGKDETIPIDPVHPARDENHDRNGKEAKSDDQGLVNP